MSIKLSAILEPMIAAGVPGEVILATVKAFEDQQNDALEKRREADRERQSRKRSNDRLSRDVTLRHGDSLLVRERDARGDVKQINSEKPKQEKKDDNAAKPLSDLAGFKAELQAVISPEQIEAIIDVRRRKKAAITQHAGKLLVYALKACPDISAAADEMVLRNWIGIKPEWMAGRHAQAPPTPPRLTAHQQRTADAKAEIEKFLNPDKRYEPEPSGHTATLDLDARDFRSERTTGFGSR